LGHKGRPVRKDHLVLLVQLEVKERKGHKGQQAIQDHKDLLALRAFKGQLVQLVL
jgi:hypothetical protein